MKFPSIILVLLGLLAFSFNSNLSAESDGCSTYFPISVGMEWSMKNTDKKGKETGRTTIKVLDAKPTEGGLSYKMKGIYQLDGKDEFHESNFEYQCVDNVIKLDMERFFPPELKEMEGVSFDIESDGMEIPLTLIKGERLADAKVKVKISMNGMKLMEMVMTVTNRVVAVIEDLTTEAGTYSCAKITSTNNISMGFAAQTTTSIQWISSDVGIVKTEEFDKKGKLESGSELVSFKK